MVNIDVYSTYASLYLCNYLSNWNAATELESKTANIRMPRFWLSTLEPIM